MPFTNFIFLLALAVCALPVMYQLVYGTRAIRRTIKKPLWQVFLLSLTLQFVCTWFAFFLALQSFSGKCATPALGVIGLGVLFAMLTGLIFIIQFVAGAALSYKKQEN